MNTRARFGAENLLDGTIAAVTAAEAQAASAVQRRRARYLPSALTPAKDPGTGKTAAPSAVRQVLGLALVTAPLWGLALFQWSRR